MLYYLVWIVLKGNVGRTQIHHSYPVVKFADFANASVLWEFGKTARSIWVTVLGVCENITAC